MPPISQEQLLALPEKPAFRVRVKAALSSLAFEGASTAQGGMTDDEYKECLRRSLRLINEPNVVTTYAERILTTLIGSAVIQATEDEEGADIDFEDLKDEVEKIVIAVNNYERLAETVVI